MSDIRAGVLLTLRDQFSRGMRNAGGAAGNFASGVTGAMDRANRAIGRVGTALGTIGAGIGVGMAVNHVIDLDAKLTRLGTQANVSAEKMDSLKKRITDVATAPDIKVNSAEIMGAIDSIIERTGDMGFVEQNLRSIGLAIQATGASGADIGGLFAEFQKMGLGADEAMQALDTLTVQGKNGAFTLENLAGLGPRVMSAYAATGRSGTDSLREMGAALQVIRMGTGSSEQAATSFEAVMRNLLDPNKQKQLKQIGVSVRDQYGEFRPITELMEEIVAKSGGSAEALGAVFDSEAMRAFNFAIGEFQRTSSLESVQRFYDMQGDGTTVMADSARNAATMRANLNLLRESFLKFADTNLAEPVARLTGAFNEFAEDPERIQRAFKIVTAGLAGIAAIKIGSGVLGMLANLKSLRGGSLTLKGAASAMAQPVTVTNWPGGSFGGTGVAGQNSGSAALATGGKMALAKGAAGAAAKKMLPLAIVANLLQSGYNIYNNKNLPASERRKQNTGEAVAAVGGVGGALAGAAAGAALGSIVPGIGNAVGFLGGAILGGLGMSLGRKGGGALGRLVGGKIFGSDSQEEYAQRSRTRLWNDYRTNNGPAGQIQQMPEGKIDLGVDLKVTADEFFAELRTMSNTVPGLSAETGRASVARSNL